uniref:Uncharacterized protein n=1 Tax=Meloidogyne enterolobii TaxID=390850 RepID=A0A6V7U945_MELEN|nr:unnamed protein product [Meloidogyne enterolobii]
MLFTCWIFSLGIFSWIFSMFFLDTTHSTAAQFTAGLITSLGKVGSRHVWYLSSSLVEPRRKVP